MAFNLIANSAGKRRSRRFTEFEEYLSKSHVVKIAREVIEYNKYSKGLLSPKQTEKLLGKETYQRLLSASKIPSEPELSVFNTKLNTALNYNPKNKE